MKPLNRPMFKNGGPIKEGIMSGMKDSPQQLVKSNADGSRPGYAGPAMLALPYIGTAARFLARPFGQFIARQSRGGKMLGLKPVEKFQPNIFGKYLAASPEGRLLTGGAGIAGKTGSTIFKGAKSLAKSPLTVGTGVYMGGKKLYDMATGEKTPEAQKDIEAAGGPPGGGDPNMFAKPKESKIDADKLAKDRIEANRKRYYELMGLDKAKKDDIYRGLIDASNIIQEEGADLKGSIKSGTLQNRIINALSKQLDKSADLKKQIDAAILKGEITKDIEQSKVPDNIRTARMLGISDKEYKDKILGNTSLKENLIAAYNKQGSFPAGNQLAGFARNSGINITGVEDSQAVKDWMEANSSNEEGYIQSLVKEGKVPDGTYVINNRIFQVNGQDITSIV